LTDLENLAMACPRCNARKWIHVEALDDTGQLTPLFNPRTQDWTAHFRWSDADPTVIEPLTSIGRATVTFLDLNSSRHLTIRSLLKSLDLHPPRDP
jgi:hypothetical protein